MTFVTGRFRNAALLCCFVLLAACDSPSEPTSPIGNYNLTTVDGDGLPAVIFQAEGYSLSVERGTLEIGADNSYLAVINTLEVVDLAVSEYVDSLKGSWTQDNMGAMLFSLDETTLEFSGVWQGRQVTMMLSDGFDVNALVFRRSR